MQDSTRTLRGWPRDALLVCSTVAFACFMVRFALTASARQNDTAARLVASSSIDVALTPGAAHSYSLDLTSDQYVSLDALQQGIDVAVTIHGPDGAALVEVDGPTGKYGRNEYASSQSRRVDIVWTCARSKNRRSRAAIGSTSATCGSLTRTTAGVSRRRLLTSRRSSSGFAGPPIRCDRRWGGMRKRAACGARLAKWPKRARRRTISATPTVC